MEALYCPGGQVHLFWLAEVLHIGPVRTVHTEVSHLHSALLATAPAKCAHVGGGVHLLVAFVHRNPVAAVQTTLSQMHVPLFNVAPLVCVQSGAAMHRQDRVEVHNAVEVDSVL